MEKPSACAQYASHTHQGRKKSGILAIVYRNFLASEVCVGVRVSFLKQNEQVCSTCHTSLLRLRRSIGTNTSIFKCACSQHWRKGPSVNFQVLALGVAAASNTTQKN